MLHKLIDHSPDLKRLRDEGYELYISNSHILISSIPYLNSSKEICLGTVVSPLTIVGDKAGPPSNHVVHFVGDHPCNKDGSIITALSHSDNKVSLGEGIEVDRSFSNKPVGGFKDYYQKLTSYIKIICGPAQSTDHTVTPKTFRLVTPDEADSDFIYPDTNASRAGIGAISNKLKGQKIGIIGIGGTGSYLLDFLSKCPVEEIRIFDNDQFKLHNAFRSPGAPLKEVLKNPPKKNSLLP